MRFPWIWQLRDNRKYSHYWEDWICNRRCFIQALKDFVYRRLRNIFFIIVFQKAIKNCLSYLLWWETITKAIQKRKPIIRRSLFKRIRVHDHYDGENGSKKACMLLEQWLGPYILIHTQEMEKDPTRNNCVFWNLKDHP